MSRRSRTFFVYTVLFLLGILALSKHLWAENIRIITPYLGSIRNVYEKKEYLLDLEDSELLKGIYVQWINTQRFQWNLFVYQSSDINYATLWGGHFIFDYYFGVRGRAKYVAGTGIEFIRLDMDAGSKISPLSDFRLENTILIPYLRFGRYFPVGRGDPQGSHSMTLLPWIGIQPEFVRGDISFNFVPPPPLPPVDKTIKEDELYAIAGLNARAVLYHFIELEAKYHGTFNTADYFSTVSAMINLYASRRVGLSYRFKFMEMSSGSNTYHMGGIAFLF
jgi:hypothetical protein